MTEQPGHRQPAVPDADEALAAVRRLDAEQRAEYETPLTDSAGDILDPAALAVDEVPAGVDDTAEVELTLGQTDDLRSDGTPDGR